MLYSGQKTGVSGVMVDKSNAEVVMIVLKIIKEKVIRLVFLLHLISLLLVFVLTSGGGSALTNLPAAGLSTEALITSGITTVLDLSNAQDHKITATGICTITTSGGTEGESHTIRITNSGIATVGFSSYFQFAGGASPVLTKTDGAVNLVSFTVNKTATTTGITTELLTSVANNFS